MITILKMSAFIITLILWMAVVNLQFIVPFDFMFFIFDFVFAFAVIVDTFLPEKYGQYPILEPKRLGIINGILLTSLAVIILWLHWDIIKKVFE